MPDEEIDKVVRDAANQHHPPYDDGAWGKMEVLLDKHLPQKKDSKKPIFFWLFFLLLGGAIFFAVQNFTTKNTTAGNTTGEKKSVGTVTADAIPAATPGNNPTGTATANNTTVSAGEQSNTITNTATTITTTTKNKLRIKIARPQVEGSDNEEQYVTAKKNGYNQKGRSGIKVKKPGVASGDDDVQLQKDELVKDKANDQPELPATVKTTDIVTDDLNTTANKKDALSAKADTAGKAKPDADKTVIVEKNKTTTTATKKNKKSFTDKIAFTISAGQDLSFVTLNNAGKLKPVYGAGLSYAAGKHFIVASGFYVSNKIYSASPTQYKFTGYTSPYLKDIAADCKIFEIPLNLYYSSKLVKNHSWLGGIGLSSLLMKKESYDYIYQVPSGPSYSYQKTVDNENKHYFSVLTLSGGYLYKLNNRISFIAEPYMKIPLKGIGAGEIKLNSTGLLITTAIKPFTKKK
jgi:hypothetical protein